MVVYHASSLHMSVHNLRANKLQTPIHQVFAKGHSFWRVYRHFMKRFPIILFSLTTDKLPLVVIKRSKFLLYV